MKINKFKKVGKNKYKIIFDNTDLTLYEDVILKYDLLIKKEVDLDLIDKIIEENKYEDAFETSLSYIEIKMRNRKEIIDYLRKKEFNEKHINYALDKLDKLNLLNDKKYIEAFINDKVNLTLDGPFKIKKSLLSFDLNENDIDNYLNTFGNDVWQEKLNKIINKKKSLMKNKSYTMFINKLKLDLYNMGYDKYMIDNTLMNIEYNSNAIDKDIEKATKKFKNDRNKIISSLMRKGYSYEKINSKLKEYND